MIERFSREKEAGRQAGIRCLFVCPRPTGLDSTPAPRSFVGPSPASAALLRSFAWLCGACWKWVINHR